MSLINKMLHDLDRRNGFVAPGVGLPLQQVRPVVQRPVLRFWVRGIVGLVVLAGAGRMAWIAHELRPRPALATELAFRAEAEARARPPAVPAVAEEPEPLPAEAEEPTLAADPAAQAHAENLKLALSIETPIPERQPRISRPAAVRRTPSAADAKAAAPDPMPLLASIPSGRVERRDRSTTPAERTETQFTSAMNLVNAGRIAEAESALGALIASNPNEERARQALVALLLDQRRLEEAVLVLRQGIALNPAQTQFALVLGRILAERRDYNGALEVLMRARPGAKTAEFNNLLAAVLQRLARHREAAAAYRAALEASPDNAGALMGLAISLETLQERTDALEAYRRALASASLTPDLRAYAEQKVKELR